MKKFLSLIVLLFAIAAGQGAYAFLINFKNFDISQEKALTSDILNEKIDHTYIEWVDVFNVGYGKENSSTPASVHFPFNASYGDASVRIKLKTGNKTITEIKINGTATNGYYTINGVKADDNKSIAPMKPMSVIDITFHRNHNSGSGDAYMTSVNIKAGENSSAYVDLTYFDFQHPATDNGNVIYVNPGQNLYAVAQGGESVKVIYDNREIASSTIGLVDFKPFGTGTYSVVSYNNEVEEASSEYNVIVTDQMPAHGAIASPATEMKDGHYYLIGGNSNYTDCLAKDLNILRHKSLDDGSLVVKEDALVVKPVKDGDNWRLLVSDDGKGLCAVDGKLSIGLPSVVEIEKVESNGFIIKINGLIIYSQGATFKLDENPPITNKTKLYTLSRSVGDDCVAKTSFDTWQNGEAMYAVGNVEVQLPAGTPVGTYYLYCGGRRLAEFVDGVAEANLPATGGAALTVVCEDNGYVKGVTTLKTNAWEEVANVSFVKNISSNYRLHYDEQNRRVNVYIPLTLDAEIEYSHTAEVKCVEYPQASIITEGGHPVVFIPNYLTNVNMADVQGMTLDPIDVEVTPLIYVAEPQIMARSTDYSTGFVRGQTTTHHYEFSAGNVSAVDSIMNDTFVATYYTVEGRRLTGEPTTPGIYIMRSGTDVCKKRFNNYHRY